MANTANPGDENEIPWDLALKLLRKLADDDAFRDAYRKDAAAALRLLGFPATIAGDVRAGAGKLGTKADFEAALALVSDRMAHVFYCQIPPHMKLAAGVSKTFTDPFEGS